MMNKLFLFIALLASSSSAVPLEDFFPFGPQVSDSMIYKYDTNVGPFNLTYTVPFFDYNYNHVWISTNGALSFTGQYFYGPENLSWINGSVIVAGYWYEHLWYNMNDTANEIYYQIHHEKSRSNITSKIFNKATDYVRKFFPQQRLFEPKLVITSTWYFVGLTLNVTEKLNNTFQIVFCTDEDRSFVFFLYHDLQWNNPYNNSYLPSVAGFRDGIRDLTVSLEYSGTDEMVNLKNMSNVNVPGLFAFRVDSPTINAGGCHENTSLVSFRPRMTSQLGSSAIDVYGPCFNNQTKVKCKFGSSLSIVDGIVVDEFRAICLTPFAPTHEAVPVSVSIDNGQKFTPAGSLTFSPLKFGSDEVMIEPLDGDNLLHANQSITLSWIFSEKMKNKFPKGAKVKIQLWPVTFNNQSQLQRDQTPIILVQNMNVTDTTIIKLPQNMAAISVCFIQVLVYFNSNVYAGLNTGLLTVRNSPSLARALCDYWASKQPEPSTWNQQGLRPCPMTRQQAIAAGRCCYQRSKECYLGNTDVKNCWLHRAFPGRDEPSAMECYVSITSNVHGAEAECCYDTNGTIITRGRGAGTDRRYGETQAPVKHFFHDTLPYLQCCMMNAGVQECNKYMSYRPPRRGSNTMGENGAMWGDPHYETLDGTFYTFNGYGEYVYLAISNESKPGAVFNPNPQSYAFMSQIRTIPIESGEATVAKAFAARSNDKGAKTIRFTITHREQLIMHYGNDILEFEDDIDSLFFPEMTVIRLSIGDNRYVQVSWNIGVTIEIKAVELAVPSKQLVLNIAASVSETFRGKTYGLLGTYDGITSNDLRNKNGNIIKSNGSLEQIHKDFGVTWAINATSSLLFYEPHQSAGFFEMMNNRFNATFIDPLANNANYRSVCQIDPTSLPSQWSIAQRTCYYDISKTKDDAFAKTSFLAGQQVIIDQDFQKNPPSFNPSLPIQMKPKPGELVTLNLSASSEYISHVVTLIVLHQPTNSVFNNKTGLFRWTAVKGEHYLSVQAVDKNFNLKSKHDINFNVEANDSTTTVKPSITTTRATTKLTTRTTTSGTSTLFQETIILIAIVGFTHILRP